MGKNLMIKCWKF